jgi:excisionase family DNA binding protein
MPETPEPTPRILYKLDEFGRLAGLSLVTVRRLVKRGELPSVKIGRSVRIPREGAERWIASLQDATR